MAVFWGGCSAAEVALPYLPFLEAVGNYRRANLEQLRQRLGPAQRELAYLFPQLDTERAPRDVGDPTETKLRLFEAVLSLLTIPADQQGLLVVIEDLHWADASTRELLDYLARRLRDTRIMVLATYRSDELYRKHPLLPVVQGWRRAGVAEVIELKPLPPDGVADMVHAIFDQPIRAEFRDFLHNRSEGNPFVLEEFLKAALDRGDIYRTQARWERKSLDELKIPPTVRDTILLRVERLSEDQAEILRVAAVLGESFAYQTLVAVSGRDKDVVQAALHNFVQQQLTEEHPERRGQYRFRHALTREAIYEDLIAPRREELHARGAEVLRQQPRTNAVDLAHHLLAASRWEEAIPMCIKAAEEAERRRGYLEAVELYGRVLPHLTDRLTRGQILARLGNAYFLAGDPGRAQPYLEEGIQRMDECRQGIEAASYRLSLDRCYRDRSRPDLARAEYERARESLEPQGPSEDLANAHVHLPRLELLRALHLGGALQARRPAYTEAGTYWWLGEPEKAFRALEKALPLARAADDTLAVTNIQRILASVYAELGNFQEARRLLRGLEVPSERQGIAWDRATAIRIALASDTEAAVREAQPVFEPLEWMPLFQRRLLFDQAVEAFLKAGMTVEAGQLVVRTRTEEPGDRNPHQARMEGRLALAQGDLMRALSHLNAAGRILARGGLPPRGVAHTSGAGRGEGPSGRPRWCRKPTCGKLLPMPTNLARSLRDSRLVSSFLHLVLTWASFSLRNCRQSKRTCVGSASA